MGKSIADRVKNTFEKVKEKANDIGKYAKIALAASPLVAGTILGTNNVEAQTYAGLGKFYGDQVLNAHVSPNYANKGNFTTPAEWDLLQNKTERKNYIDSLIKLDSTNFKKYVLNDFDCDDFSDQTIINFAGIEDIFGTSIATDPYYDTTKNMKFNIPLYRVTTTTTSGTAHRIITVLIGDDITNFNDWYFLEPQTDGSVSPGDQSMNPNKPVKIDRLAKYWSSKNNKFTYGYVPLVEFNLSNGNPSLSFMFPNAVQNRTIIPVYFNNITTPNDTTVELGTSTDTSVVGVPDNVFKNAWLTYTDSSTQKMDGTSNQDNYTIKRFWIVNNHELVDTNFVQLIHVRDTKAPQIILPADTTMNYSKYIDLSTLKRATVNDNSTLPTELTWKTFSNQDPDSTKLEHYKFLVELEATATDSSGNSSSATRKVQVVKPNTLAFKYFPQDTVVSKLVDAKGRPIVKDTMAPSNEISYSWQDVHLGDGVYNRMWVAKGSMQGDSIVRTQKITDKSVGLEERTRQRDETPAYPNPAQGLTTAIFDANYSGRGRVELWGMGGQKLVDKQINVNSGENSVSVDLSEYTKGMYLFRIFDENGKLIEDNRLIKK
jgi:hypothetical protein